MVIDSCRGVLLFGYRFMSGGSSVWLLIHVGGSSVWLLIHWEDGGEGSSVWLSIRIGGSSVWLLIH